MKLVDTHTHLYLDEFEPTPGDAVRRAIDAGVIHMIFPNVGLDSIERMARLHSEFPDVTSMAMGLHPTEVGEDADEVYAAVMDAFNSSLTDWVAVGEIGMDLYWDKTFEAKQMQVFDAQLALALRHSLPVIIHCREALDQTLEALEAVSYTHLTLPTIYSV